MYACSDKKRKENILKKKYPGGMSKPLLKGHHPPTTLGPLRCSPLRAKRYTWHHYSRSSDSAEPDCKAKCGNGYCAEGMSARKQLSKVPTGRP